MATKVREYLAENNRDRLLPGEQLHFITEYNNELRRRGLSTNLPIPGFLKVMKLLKTSGLTIIT